MMTKSLGALAVSSFVGTALHFAATGYTAGYNMVKTRVNAEANAQVDSLARAFGYELPRPMQIESAIEFAKVEAQLRGIHPDLVVALLTHESAQNEFAESRVGARGLMQIMPNNYKRCGLKNPNELWDWRKNIRCGVQIFGEELRHYNWDVVTALKAYNGGTRCAEQITCEESVRHARAVLTLFGRRELAVNTGIKTEKKNETRTNTNRPGATLARSKSDSKGLRGKPAKVTIGHRRVDLGLKTES